jgi:hypothetical protein
MTDYERERLDRIARILEKWASGKGTSKKNYSLAARREDARRAAAIRAQIKRNAINIQQEISRR